MAWALEWEEALGQCGLVRVDAGWCSAGQCGLVSRESTNLNNPAKKFF
jgi:hypothetical protein